MRCPICQTENPSSARVCSHCGGGLTASAAGSGIAGTGGFGGGPLKTEVDRGKKELPPVIAASMPTRFESYEILRKEDGSLWELGRGAMGITYKAIDTDLQVPVALKVINPAVLGNQDAAERFLREARSAAKLRHGNIASVFRLGRAGETHFYAMEFCEGQTVHQLVDRRGPLELKLALEITRQVSNALVVAQDHGVVHRDIKPSNLMVTGRVPDEFTIKVIDFGLAKHTAPDSAAIDISVASNRAGFVGTAHFASPEQLEDRPVDFRSDIYSLGVTLWFMLTGRPLFEGSLTRVVTQHLVQKPPIEKLQWLPARVAALLESMLAKEPEGRPASTRELRDQLQMAVEEASYDVTFAASPGQSPAPASSAGSRAPTPPSSGSAVAASTPSTWPPGLTPSTQPPASASASASPAATIPPAPQPPTNVPPAVPPPSRPPSFNLPPPPPTHPPSPYPAQDKPVRPKPHSAGPLILVGVLLVLLVVFGVGAGYAFNRWGKQLFAKKSDPTVSTPAVDTTPDDSAASTPAPPADGLTQGEALRQLRLAQEAAEKLADDYRRADVNSQLLTLVLNRADPDPDAVNTYRTTQRVIEQSIIGDEQQYLICAKRLVGVPPDVLRAAFDQLDREVTAAGLGWRTKVTELLRRHIANTAPNATRIDPELRDQLKGLQKD